MAKARIPIPSASDPLGVLTLVKAVSDGITKAGSKALIGGELAAELQAVAAKVPAALAAHKEAQKLKLRLEELYEFRDGVVKEALPLVQRGSKTLQGNLGPARLREMGGYGYTVNDSPPAPKKP